MDKPEFLVGWLYNTRLLKYWMCTLQNVILNSNTFPSSSAVFESTDKIIIIMEYASNGELYDFINNKHQLPESDARRFFRQIVSAVHYCHKVNTFTYDQCFITISQSFHVYWGLKLKLDTYTNHLMADNETVSMEVICNSLIQW